MMPMAITAPANAAPELAPIYQMLTHISAQVANGNAETSALREEVRTFNSKILDVAYDVQEQDDLLQTTIAKFNKYVERMETMVQATIWHEREIETMQEKFEDMELNTNWHNLIINGIREQEEEDCLQLTKDFLKNELEIETDIEIV